jgi:hypothetical protein
VRHLVQQERRQVDYDACLLRIAAATPDVKVPGNPGTAVADPGGSIQAGRGKGIEALRLLSIIGASNIVSKRPPTVQECENTVDDLRS